jgi:3-hydroxyisobutyrate dehydrogenase-like beta-hydroxyacid dehydrogenase
LASVSALKQVNLKIITKRKNQAQRPPPPLVGVVVETSTLSMTDKLNARAQLKARGVALLDCPMSGTAARRISGGWTLLASGPKVVCNPVSLLGRAFDLNKVSTELARCDSCRTGNALKKT